MLDFEHVVFQYAVEDFNIIDDLSFHVEKGEFVSIIGPSGCGKSTIFRLINRLLQPKSGEIRIAGESIYQKKSPCGYMPQQDLLFPWRTVEENLRLPMEIRGGLSKAEMKEKCKGEIEGTPGQIPRRLRRHRKRGSSRKVVANAPLISHLR